MQNKENTKESLSLESIQSQFSVPLHQAALKLNVSVVELKKRCRELNIHRWPYRKRKTLATLSQVRSLPFDKETPFQCFRLSKSPSCTTKTKRMKGNCNMLSLTHSKS